MTGEAGHAARDDAVLPATRVLAALIVPFLVVAFAVLYGFPAETERLFAWRIEPPMTAMTLGAVYLGGAYFFVRAALARSWHSVEAGFVAVGMFASAMGVATIIHWDRFNHDHVAFWLWAGLYFTTPFLVWGVWIANRRRASTAGSGDVLVPAAARLALTSVGGLAVITGLFLFLWPEGATGLWPWPITALTSRVVGAIFMLGIAHLAVVGDRRWSAARLMLRVEIVMLTLILLAAARAHADFEPGNPLTWVLLGGLTAALFSAATLSVRMETRDVDVRDGWPTDSPSTGARPRRGCSFSARPGPVRTRPSSILGRRVWRASRGRREMSLTCARPVVE